MHEEFGRFDASFYPLKLFIDRFCGRVGRRGLMRSFLSNASSLASQLPTGIPSYDHFQIPWSERDHFLIPLSERTDRQILVNRVFRIRPPSSAV